MDIITPELSRALSKMFVDLKRDVDYRSEKTANKVIKPIVTSSGTQIHPTAGADRNLMFLQSSPDTTWTIPHNFNKFPSVTIQDDNGIEIEGLVTHVDANNVIIEFNTAVSGLAVLN